MSPWTLIVFAELSIVGLVVEGDVYAAGRIAVGDRIPSRAADEVIGSGSSEPSSTSACHVSGRAAAVRCGGRSAVCALLGVSALSSRLLRALSWVTIAPWTTRSNSA